MLTFPNVIIAMITPFHEDGSVNYEAAVELAKNMLTKVPVFFSPQRLAKVPL